MDAEELRRRVADIAWHHSIDLGGGVVTPGRSQSTLLPDSALASFPGRSVLDIGAWDGLYSFHAERGGAARVVGMDHYVWGVDLDARNVYWNECHAKGVLPEPGRELVDFWDDSLPGRRGFDLAREALGSKVEPLLGDVMTVDPATVGTFDVVLFLGVLYHLPEPFSALRQVRRLTREVAVIETAAIELPDCSPLLAFHAGGELDADHTNWFSPSEAALHDMCRAAGFRRMETRMGPPRRRRLRSRGSPRGCRLVVHAYP
jgi:tRNA (mo5U34)-methyltransferase